MPGRLPRARGLHVKLRLHGRLLKRQAFDLRRLSQTGRRIKFECFGQKKEELLAIIPTVKGLHRTLCHTGSTVNHMMNQ